MFKRCLLSIWVLTMLLTGGLATAQQDQGLDLTVLYEQVSPSVVYIEVLSRSSGFIGESIEQALGSGFVVDTQGHIVTNHHVVADATRIEVTFFDGTYARATVIGDDPDSDLAVIRVEVDPVLLHPVQFADSSQLRVGQDVVAIGNPFGQNWTMTTGIVSALGRSQPSSSTPYSIAQMIQTDAAINPGNSGGPLLDTQGRVIGVNTMIFTETEVNAGIGFAVPSNTVQRVLPDLIATGSYQYTWIGITGDELRLDHISLMNLDENVRGVLIETVRPNSPASKAGFNGNDRTDSVDGIPYNVGGDVIIALNDTPIRNMAELVGFLADQTRPGDLVQVTLIRDGATIVIPVTLEARPD